MIALHNGVAMWTQYAAPTARHATENHTACNDGFIFYVAQIRQKFAGYFGAVSESQPRMHAMARSYFSTTATTRPLSRYSSHRCTRIGEVWLSPRIIDTYVCICMLHYGSSLIQQKPYHAHGAVVQRADLDALLSQMDGRNTAQTQTEGTTPDIKERQGPRAS